MLTFALLFGATVGCGWHVAPIVASNELSSRLVSMAQKRGFVLQIGATYVDPTSRVVLDSVLLQDDQRSDRQPVFKAARIEVEFEIHGALSPKIHLQKITVHSPRLHVHRSADGTTNVDAALALAPGDKSGKASGQTAGGMRNYLSKHLPQLVVRDLAMAIDDDKGAALITPAGIDVRHLRFSDASLVIKDASPLADVARFDVKGNTKITGFSDLLQVEGQLVWPERAGWGRVELPEDFALEAAGFRAAVARVTVHSTGRVQLGGVSIERLPADDSPFSLDVRQIGVELTADAAPLDAIPKKLRDRLPSQALAVLRHIAEVVIESPVIVSKRPTARTAKPKKEEDSVLMPKKSKRTDPGGTTSGAKTRDLAELRSQRRKRIREEKKRKKQTAKERAMGKAAKPDTDGKKVRDAMINAATKATDRLEARLKSLRKAASAIPVRKVRIRNGRARYRDEQLEGQAAGEMSDFSAEIDRTDDGIVAVKLRFGVPGGTDGTENAVSGRVHTRTGDSQVSVRLDRLPIAPYAALLPAAISPNEHSAIEDTLVTVRYDAKARRIAVDGKGSVRHIDVDIPPISRQQITDLSFKASGKLQLDLATEKLAMDDGRVDMERVQLLFEGAISDFRTAPVFDMSVRVPTVHCQDAADSIVPRFAPVLNGMRCSGTMAFRIGFALKTANMRSLKFEFEPTLQNLKIESLGKYIDFAVLEGPFEHNARQPDGTLYTFVTGPGSERWVPIDEITENLIKVVTTTEDGLFFFHRGFSVRQIRGAMVANLRKGRFVRGASTISQQMAKNLFFVEREKTISRKLQEAVVTWEMEHRLTKQQILELYFNIIEFGPKIYGIKAAANHFFNRAADRLTLLQAIWLGSIIPGPRKFYHQFVRGSSGETWRNYLCWIGRIMLKREKITADQLARLGTCNVVFGGASDGSEEPQVGADFGLGHEGDPTIGDDTQPRAAGEGARTGDTAVERLRDLKRRRAAPSVSADDQP